MTPEKYVQNDIINYLKKLQKEGRKLFFERRQAGGFSYKRGICDLYAVYEGIHIEIEVKAEGGELSVNQEKWKEKCKKLNIIYICAYSLEEFKNFFENIIKNSLLLNQNML